MTAIEFPLYQIKAEVGKLWQKVTRSSVLTLVAYAPGRDEAIKATINALRGQHPSRAIIITTDRTGARTEPTASVEVTSHSTEQGNGKVGSEEVTIYLPPDKAAHVADYIVPLLLSDMPVFVWWAGGSPDDAALFSQIVDLGDYLIFDSADFAMPERNLVQVGEFIEHYRAQPVNYKAFNDFNWMRIRLWREMVAQCFDPPNLPYLERITDLRIGFASATGLPLRPTQAYLLAGWLAATLQWTITTHQPTPAGGTAFSVQTPYSATPVKMELAPYTVPQVTVSMTTEQSTAGDAQQLTLPLGTLLFVEATAATEAGNATFRVLCEPDFKNTVTDLTLPDGTAQLLRRTAIEPLDEVTMLAQQLMYFNYDHLYEDAVLAIRTFFSAGMAS
jgi:glucose-6-phosphate dehydrogenase assembly protein OpcA